jgi:Fe-S cluster assembly protein SufD
MEEAWKTYRTVMSNRLSQDESDPYAALNGAFLGRGLFLYIPPDVAVANLKIVSLLSSKKWMVPRLQIFLGKNASLSLIQTITGDGRSVDVLDAALDEGAHLAISNEINVEKEAKIYRDLRATLQKDASLCSFSYCKGAASVRQSLRITLEGEGADAELKGLDWLLESGQADTIISIVHEAPRTRSRQHFKKILEGRSRSRFEGKVHIAAAAQESDAYQLSQNLLLSDDARAIAKPVLEICADRVQAKHGATFSELSVDEIFYCRSRGMSEKQARDLLLEGFCKEAI